MKKNLIKAKFFAVLTLNSCAEEKGSVVDEIGRMFDQIQYHKIKIQAHYAAQP